jgi:hypothetical protein
MGSGFLSSLITTNFLGFLIEIGTEPIDTEESNDIIG